MRTFKLLTCAVLLIGSLGLTACEMGQNRDQQVLQPTLQLDTRDDSILVGESTTVFAESSNLLGREVQINWNATLGQIEPLQNGRMARFTAEQPGTSVVTAEANVDGQVLRDRIRIRVSDIQ